MVRQQGVDSLPMFLIKDMLSGDTRVNQPALVDYLSAVINQASAHAAVFEAPERTNAAILNWANRIG